MAQRQTAHQARVSQAAKEIAARIAALTDPSLEQTLAAVQAQECSKLVLCDAFWLLDNEPGWFENYQVWHPRLRSLRNQPVYGKKLFALFQ